MLECKGSNTLSNRDSTIVIIIILIIIVPNIIIITPHLITTFVHHTFALFGEIMILHGAYVSQSDPTFH